jgi:hypothetical protein
MLSAAVSLRAKVLVLLGSVLAFALAAGAVVIANLVHAAGDLRGIAERDVPLTQVLQEITAGHLEQSIRFERALRFASGRGDRSGGGAGYRAARSEFEALSAEIWRSLQRGREMAAAEPDERDPVSAALEEIDREHNEYARSVRRVFALIDRGEVARALAVAEDFRRDQDRFDQALAALLLRVGQRVEAASAEANAEAGRAVWVVTALLGVGILLALGVFAYCVRLVSETRSLRGLLPICASCKKIRDDHGYWNELEAYLEQHSEAAFTHGICAECRHELESRTAVPGPREPSDVPGGAPSGLL